jgi:poly-D-alanine transfer protein DltD
MPKTNSSVQINTHLTNCSDVRLIRYKQEAAKKEKPETLYQEQPLTRKRSGELVRSALRSSNTTKSSFSKAVRFHSHLEHIRPFLKFDKPSAVNTDLPPADKCECVTETRLGADIFGNGHDILSD